MSRASQLLTDIAVLVVALLFGMLSWLVPKRRKQIAFYPTADPSKFSGNLRPLFELLVAEGRTDRQLVWFSRSREVAEMLNARGLDGRVSDRRPLWTLLRFSTIFLDGTEARIGFGRFRLIQTWHGTGFKSIGLENPRYSWARRMALRGHFACYQLIVASSDEDAARKTRCFASAHVRIIGTPRNDVLLEGTSGADQLVAKLGPELGRVIAYCPTFRKTSEVVPFTPHGWSALDRWLVDADASLLIKRHSRDVALTVPRGLSRIRDVSGVVDDVQSLLAITDILITDYSSISTDFALTGRPMLFYLYDEDSYQASSQKLYFDPRETLPGPIPRTEAALLSLLADMSWFDAPDYRACYARFRERFHAYLDAGATKRLAVAVDPLIGEM